VTPGALRRPGALLRQRNFRLLWVGETVSGTGSAMAVVGVPLLAVTVLHASTFAVAALTAASSASAPRRSDCCWRPGGSAVCSAPWGHRG